MLSLEKIAVGSRIAGILPSGSVVVEGMQWHGASAVTVTYRSEDGHLDSEVLYRWNEDALSAAEENAGWNPEVDVAGLRLAAEANRIRLAYLFDPYLAVHTSLVQPLPHQITAVYGEMLSRHPLRFLLADDPGAGKTIMAGLLIKELIIRGDVARCLIVCPGSLAEQWQDEMHSKFGLDFELVTRDRINASPTGSVFGEMNLAIGRLDHLKRSEDLLAQLEQSDWDLIVVDEAHKMSATYFGREVSYSKRYRLGQLLSQCARHFLLMTATPHNGKEADFHLFLALLDADRFEGRFREGVHQSDPSDMMRRMVKERLVKFDGTPLFPERRAYTVRYQLSAEELRLYELVTNYVREEFNRADALQSDGRKGTVGFALTVLQRRLASSPEAIHQSLVRRRERLEKRLEEEECLRRGAAVDLPLPDAVPDFTSEDIEDLDDAPDSEVEKAEELILDRATASMTIGELKAEIAILQRLAAEAARVVKSGKDRKWEELSALMHDCPAMLSAPGTRTKMVIFTEHRDTLNYLVRRVGILLGPEAIVTIHGGMGRDERRRAEQVFRQDKDATVLIATDAAGEGINLQCAHLMVNYDLPWNPNRLEQRFGRIHRIGQTEVCHLWNLVAYQTREGAVLSRLCEKLEQEANALKGRVFDILGEAFEEHSLRDLLIEAVRYGERPDVRARLFQVVDEALDRDRIRQLIEERSLAEDAMDAGKLRDIREEMERADARRLQPHFVQAFFLAAFDELGGRWHGRERGRFELSHVPHAIRSRAAAGATRTPALARYQRVTFQKELIAVPDAPEAAFICPGHPLLNAVIDLVLETGRPLLKAGAVMVDPNDPSELPRALFWLEHTVQGGTAPGGGRRVVSRQSLFLEMVLPADGGTPSGGQGFAAIRRAGYAPYLDYREADAGERAAIAPLLAGLPDAAGLERTVVSYAVQHLVPEHFGQIRGRNEKRIAKTMAAVKDRLTIEINYWDQRARELKEREEAGKQTRLPWLRAQERADQLSARLQKRMAELEAERRISPAPPLVVGHALVIPAGLLARLAGTRGEAPSLFARETERVELAAMEAVMAAEIRLGNAPRDVSAANCGYDIESRDGRTGRLRFIEVKGRIRGASTVTVTRNEILAAFNQPEQFILALVLVPPSPSGPYLNPHEVMDGAIPYGLAAECDLRYVRNPFDREPGFDEVSVNFSLKGLWDRGDSPVAASSKRFEQ